jgi:glutamyl/glutaminyl-tRNA synthetase
MLPASPRQIEFSRLNLTRTIMSKRYLRMLVEGGYVSGWDDPSHAHAVRAAPPGFTPAAIRDFIDRIGVAKADSVVDLALLEHCVREDLAKAPPAPWRCCVPEGGAHQLPETSATSAGGKPPQPPRDGHAYERADAGNLH